MIPELAELIFTAAMIASTPAPNIRHLMTGARQTVEAVQEVVNPQDEDRNRKHFSREDIRRMQNVEPIHEGPVSRELSDRLAEAWPQPPQLNDPNGPQHPPRPITVPPEEEKPNQDVHIGEVKDTRVLEVELTKENVEKVLREFAAERFGLSAKQAADVKIVEGDKGALTLEYKTEARR